MWVGSHGKWIGPNGEQVALEVRRITPKWAKEMLCGMNGGKENRNFREISPREIRKLEGELTSGAWVLNGATIAIDDDGYVRDGQKRLQACINTGVPFDAVVVWGIPTGADLTMDLGQKRSLGQYLKRDGEKGYNTLSAALAWLWKIENSRELWGIAPPLREARDVLDQHPGIRDGDYILSSSSLIGINRSRCTPTLRRSETAVSLARFPTVPRDVLLGRNNPKSLDVGASFSLCLPRARLLLLLHFLTPRRVHF